MKERISRTPSVLESLIIIVAIFAVIIAGIRIKLGTEMSLFGGAIVGILACLYLRKPWKDIQEAMTKLLGGTMTAMVILVIVGIMVGAWIIGGTVPSLMYYGLKIVSPSLILPITFLLCSIMSIFTGTSFGSIATIGIALSGVAVGIGVPIHIVAGAVVSGAYVGDKMSPMSDSTNLASAVTGVPLYDHIGSMMRTTLPAGIITLIIYTIIGMQYSGSSLVTENIDTMLITLSDNFTISPITLIPAIMVLVVSVLKIPSILGLLSCSVLSIIFAVFTQGASFVEVVQVCYRGYVSETGVAMVDTILSRGGISSMMKIIALIIMACLMGGALQASGSLKVIIEDTLMKKMKSSKALVLITMLYNYTILLMSGNQMLGIVMPGATFSEAYDKMDIHRKVLSRTIEDTSTIGAGLVPWSVAAVYTMGILGCDASYIPYAIFCYIVPMFTILCAITGFAMWHSDGSPLRGSKKVTLNHEM